jgi:hypothetical protein
MNIALQPPIVAFRLDRYGRVDLAKIKWTFLLSSADLPPLSVTDGFRHPPFLLQCMMDLRRDS